MPTGAGKPRQKDRRCFSAGGGIFTEPQIKKE
jgi:hypothetical protein